MDDEITEFVWEKINNEDKEENDREAMHTQNIKKSSRKTHG